MARTTLSTNDDVLIVGFLDNKILDHNRAEEVGRELLEAVPQAQNKLLLDFTGVTFMSSAMITKLVTLNKECQKQQVRLKFCNIEANLMEVFRITGLGGDALGSPVPNPTKPPADSSHAKPSGHTTDVDLDKP